MAGRRSRTSLDEAAVLSRVGAWTGRALGTVVRQARLAAVSATATAATAGAQLAVAGGRSLGRARAGSREAAVRAGDLAHQLTPNPDDVRRELAQVIAPRRRRRWPWVLGAVVVAGVGAVAVALRRPVAPPPAPAPPRVQDVVASTPHDDEPLRAG